MVLTAGGIVIDYDPDAEQFSVADQATGIVAYTNDPSAIYGIVRAFQADPDPDDYTTDRDSGDEDPHA